MQRTLVQRIDALLYRRGFAVADARKLMRNQVLLAVAGSALACLGTGFSGWGLSFAAGALIISVNFWWLVKAAQELVKVRHGAVFTLLTLFYGRLVLTGVAIAALVAWLGASVFGLLAGLSTVVINATLWGVLQIRHKVPVTGNGKEA
ncbi:MAG: ATP synthase subunit I [Proteobacteria bacterium]|nr:ATP synthase subunit I [Pseudomonadota bacterium]MBU1596369.1 ATP synthase subunit I [Pseudomonadota bacterium]